MTWFIIKIIIDIIGNIILFASVAFLIGKAAWEWQKSDSFIEDRKKAKKEIDKWTEPVVKILLLIWATRLRIIYVIFALVISGYLFKIFIKLSGQFFNMADLEPEGVRNLAIAFIGTTSGLGALFGIYLAVIRSETTERQTRTAEDALITDRLNKAIERLSTNDEKGKPIIEVRVGALYALERIAQDSLRDHIPIMDIICAYVKTNSPLPKKKKPLGKDIKTALNIISWRGNGHKGKKRLEKESRDNYRLDLSYCDLHDAGFRNANLSGANLYYSNLDDAHFYKSNLSEATLNHASLNKVNIDNTDMTRTSFYWAKMTDASISESKLKTTGFFYANLSKTTIANRSNLYRVQFYKTNLSNAMLYNVDLTKGVLISTNLKDAEIINSNLNKTLISDVNTKGTSMENSYAYECYLSERGVFTKKQLNSMFCGISTGIPSHLKKRPKHWPTKELHKDVFMKQYWEWRKGQSDDPRYDPESHSKHSSIMHGGRMKIKKTKKTKKTQKIKK